MFEITTNIRAMVTSFVLVWVTGCAGLPADQAAGTPAARIASGSLFSVQANGVSVGAAVAVPCTPCGGPVLVTNAHVMRQAGARFTLRPAVGGEPQDGSLLAYSPRIDLAVLRLPAGVEPAAPGAAPAHGAPVWAVGPEGLGRARQAPHEAAPRAGPQARQRPGAGYELVDPGLAHRCLA